MSLTQGEYDCNEEVGIDEQEKDIADQVLVNILKMSGIERSFQAQNIFKLDGKKTSVRISKKGLTIFHKRSLSCLHLKNRNEFIPSQNILSVRTSLSSQSNGQNSSGGYGTFRTYMRGSDEIYEGDDSRRLIFVGTMPDILTIYYVKHRKENGIMKLKKIQLHHSDSDIINWWNTTLLTVVNPKQSRPKSLLVFINPFGGHGKAKQIWESQIANIFKIAGIGCKVIVTESSNHAHTVIQSAPLHNYDGIISVGGDGMFSQVFNGLIARTARDNKLDVNERKGSFPQADIRVGLIPAGSTDCVAMCLHGNNDPVTSALHIALGDRLDVDVSAIHTEIGLERFVMTMCSYGYFGDLMKHSENLRCLGRYRYDLSGVRTFLRHKSYSGTINYVPSGVPSQKLLTDSCGEGCPQCSYKELEKTDIDTQNCDDAEHECSNFDPPCQQSQTQQINGKFLAILGCNTTCTDRHAKKGMDTAAHTGDGFQDVIIVNKTSYFGFLRYLVRSAYQTSHPFTLPYVQAIRVKEWEFIPDGNNPREFSTWNCDGEMVHDPNIFVKSHKKLVPVFARGVYNPQFSSLLEDNIEDDTDFQGLVPEV